MKKGAGWRNDNLKGLFYYFPVANQIYKFYIDYL